MEWNQLSAFTKTCELRTEEAQQDQEHCGIEELSYHIGREDASMFMSGIQERYTKSDVNLYDYFEGLVEELESLLQQIKNDILYKEEQ